MIIDWVMGRELYYIKRGQRSIAYYSATLLKQVYYMQGQVDYSFNLAKFINILQVKENICGRLPR